MVKMIHEANARILALGNRLSPELGIATTLTLGMITGGQLYLAHVGDSRCYVWHDGRIELLTLDHSLENEARLRGAQRLLAYFTESSRGRRCTRCLGQSGAARGLILSCGRSSRANACCFAARWTSAA